MAGKIQIVVAIGVTTLSSGFSQIALEDRSLNSENTVRTSERNERAGNRLPGLRVGPARSNKPLSGTKTAPVPDLLKDSLDWPEETLDIEVSSKKVETSQPALKKTLPERKSDWLGLETGEAEAMILDLAKKNEELKKEVLDLQEQVRTLTHSLAAHMAKSDEIRFKRDRGELEPVQLDFSRHANLSGNIRLVDVNEKLNVAVLDAGNLSGVKPGMIFGIDRSGQQVARLRALYVRSHLTGAEILDLKKGQFPVPGDRVVPLLTESVNKKN